MSVVFQGTKSKSKFSSATISLNEKSAAPFDKSVEQGSTEFLNKEEERYDTKSQGSLVKEEEEEERGREGHQTKSQEAEACLDEEVKPRPEEVQEMSIVFGDQPTV